MIKIDENNNKVVTYDNDPDVERQLFPNIPLTVDISPLQDEIDALDERVGAAEDDISSIQTTLQTFNGQPVVVDSVEDMTDQNIIYVYVGDEAGYTSGDWYYYDGTGWVSGGAYVANPVVIDDTLTQAGEAADAKAVGDELTQIKSDFNLLGIAVIPEYSVEFNTTGGSAVNYTDVVFEQGKRYTFVPYVTKGTLNNAELIFSSSSQRISLRNIGFATTATSQGTGYLRLSPYSGTVNSTVYIFDTTDNDTLKDYLEANGYQVVNSFLPSDLFVDSIEKTVTNMDGSDIPLNPLIGYAVKPDFTAEYIATSATDKEFTNITFVAEHRYTFVPYVTRGRLLKATIIPGGQIINLNGVDIATSATAESNGHLKLNAFSTPINAIVYIFDTTGNDTLKSFLEEYGHIVVNGLMPSQSFEDNIKTASGSYWNKIIFVGDSQTQRGTFVTKFKSLYSNPNDVDYYGYGGAGSDEISAVQGGLSLFINPFTIPSDTTPVQIEAISDVGNMLIGQQNTKGLTGINIDGITGDITYSNGHNYFTRSETGTAKEITRPIKLKTGLYDLNHYFAIIEIGSNDYSLHDADLLAEKIINDAESMMRHNGNSFFFVLGITMQSDAFSVPDVNTRLARHFGERFIDIRTYMIEYGLEDEGITPTSQDIEDIANGDIPSSLRDDAIHFNQYGGNVIGTLIYNRGVELGYWD